MFQDQLSRNSQNVVSWYLGWEKYVFLSCTLLGMAMSVGIQQLVELRDLTRFQLATGRIEETQLVSIFSLSILRDRAISLQDRRTLITKIMGIIGCVGGTIAAIVLSATLTHRLAHYQDANATYQLTGLVINYCPAMTSYFFAMCCILVAMIFLASIFHLLATTWIIYQRAVFLSPPPGVWDDPEEIKALNWICTEDGDVIPTIYMLPPSVHRQHREVSFCMLYSHGNAMDLADTVYTLRALAETFDCAVMGYEYPGYGMCNGSISESRCYAAIAAAFQTLVEYHKLQPRQIILFGRSLGTGPSIHFASRQGKDLGGLILQSPLKSILRTVLPLERSYPMDMFCSIDKIADVQVPTFIMHGRRDTMVPFKHGEALWHALNPAYRHPPLWLDEASHNDMPRPWVVTEEHAPGETEAEHTDKLRRNKESRIFISKCREYLQVVRQHKDALDAADALARAERKAKKEARLQEEAREREQKRDSEAQQQQQQISNGVVSTGVGASQAAIELANIELAVMNGSKATGAMLSSLVDVADDDDGPSSYPGPIIVVGGKAGDAQFQHLYANATSSQVPSLRQALGGGGAGPTDQTDRHAEHANNNHASTKRHGEETESLIARQQSPKKSHHGRSGSLRGLDRRQLSPSRGAIDLKSLDLRSGPISRLEFDSTAHKDLDVSVLHESPDASRRPSITENMLSQSMYQFREASQIGSITYNPRLDKFDLTRLQDSRLGEELSRIEPSHIDATRDDTSRHTTGDRRAHDRLRDHTSERDSRIDFSRTVAPEVSRIGPDTTQKLHSVAVRHPPNGHSPQSLSRSVSISNSMQSPSSFYGSGSTNNNTLQVSVGAQSTTAGGVMHHQHLHSTGHSAAPTASPSPALQPISSNTQTHSQHTSLYLGPTHTPESISTTPLHSGRSVSSASGGAVNSSAFTIHPATILAPNPALVPLTMSQLQELMDALKSRERLERERLRQRERDGRDRPAGDMKEDSASSTNNTALFYTSGPNLLRKPPAHTRDSAGGLTPSASVTREASISSRRRMPIATGRGSPSPPLAVLTSPQTPPQMINTPDAAHGEVMRIELADYTAANPSHIGHSAPASGERKSSRASVRSSARDRRLIIPGGGSSTAASSSHHLRVSSSGGGGTAPTSPLSQAIRVQIHTPGGGAAHTRPTTSNSPPTNMLAPGRASPPTMNTTMGRSPIHIPFGHTTNTQSGSSPRHLTDDHGMLRPDRGGSSGVDRDRDRRNKDSRLSQHRISISEYDHTSLMSRSRSATSRSRWPYSVTAAEAAEENGEDAEGDDDRSLVYDAGIEEEDPTVDHSTLQLDDHTASAAKGLSIGTRSPIHDPSGLQVLTPVSSKNSTTTKNVIALGGSPNTPAAIVAKRQERASLRDSQLAQLNAALLAAAIDRPILDRPSSSSSSSTNPTLSPAAPDHTEANHIHTHDDQPTTDHHTHQHTHTDTDTDAHTPPTRESSGNRGSPPTMATTIINAQLEPTQQVEPTNTLS